MNEHRWQVIKGQHVDRLADSNDSRSQEQVESPSTSLHSAVPACPQVALRAAQHVAADTASSSSSSSSATDAAQAALQLPANAMAGLLSQIGLSRHQPSQVLEDLRLQLNWEVVPILRNRQRLLFFGESPFDSFGPVPPPVPDYSRDLADFGF